MWCCYACRFTQCPSHRASLTLHREIRDLRWIDGSNQTTIRYLLLSWKKKAPYEIKFNLMSILSERSLCWQLLSKEPLQLLLALSCLSYIIVTRLLQLVLCSLFPWVIFAFHFTVLPKFFSALSLFFFKKKKTQFKWWRKTNHFLSCSTQSIDSKRKKQNPKT